MLIRGTRNIWMGMKRFAQLRHFHGEARIGKVRVRFAPSPTGFLHIGGLRTAFYNYLFAKSNSGSFILRIEDTDRSRYVPGSAENLQKVLEWVGLRPDEGPFDGGQYGPYIQSERLDLYHLYAEKLLERNMAYHCFCTERRLELLRKDAGRRGHIPKYDNRCRELSWSTIRSKLHDKVPHVIRFKMGAFLNHFDDMVYGPIAHNPADTEGDPILIKSDGFPTYHFANVVDDHLMEISHVLRGVEWQVSTPKHILLYNAFGWHPPQFAHLPVIVNSDGSKLSKRQGDVHMEYFKNSGYFPEAILNFMIHMGGGFADSNTNTLYSLQEMIAIFSISKVSTNPCQMDPNHLEVCNRLAIKHHLTTTEGTAMLTSVVRQLVLERFGSSVAMDLDDSYIRRIISLYKDRLTCLNHLSSNEMAYLWVQNFAKPSNCEHLPFEVISDLIQELDALDDDFFTKEHVLAVLRHFSKSRSVKFSMLMEMIRYLLTGCKEGPAVADMLEVLGKEMCLKRINMYSKEAL